MLQPDTHLGMYRLLGRLGAGGMGEVWKAEDTRLGRLVAIKILSPSLASHPDSLARMKREARTAAQLNHPNIATIHAFEQDGDTNFIVMELVEGEPLSAVIHRGPLREGDVCRIGQSVAEALAEAHAKGIVHRDIKPDNIIVNGPRVKVLDFGIAKQIEQETINANEPTAFMTKAGYIVGTVHYMSPEQALGKPVDARTDIFSLGVVLYQMATGLLPFRGETVTETITQIVRDEAALPGSVSRGLSTVITRCMAKNRDERFASAADLARALDERLVAADTIVSGAHVQTVIERAPSSPRRWPWIAGMVALALAIGTGVMVGNRPGVEAPPKADPPPVVATIAPAAPAQTSVTITETAPEPEAPVVATPPVATPAPEKSAGDLYNEGMVHLLERQGPAAHAAFSEAVAKDPQHAQSHFRLGEMALFRRQFAEAREHLEAARRHEDQLSERERRLNELGLALLDQNRPRARQLFRELMAGNPGDPDVARFRELVGEERPFRGRRPR